MEYTFNKRATKKDIISFLKSALIPGYVIIKIDLLPKETIKFTIEEVSKIIINDKEIKGTIRLNTLKQDNIKFITDPENDPNIPDNLKFKKI